MEAPFMHHAATSMHVHFILMRNEQVLGLGTGEGGLPIYTITFHGAWYAKRLCMEPDLDR